MEPKDIVKKPIITEKATQETTRGCYSFRVDKRANKQEIKKAIEACFKVHVRGVRTVIRRGKKKRVGRGRRETKQADWKKAVVWLAEGEKIDIFETGE